MRRSRQEWLQTHGPAQSPGDLLEWLGELPTCVPHLILQNHPSMVAAETAPFEIAPAPGEQRMILYGVSWKDYVLLRDVLDGPTPRMTYRKGVLELMSPSREHELWKKNIARLVELFAHVRRLELYGYGSTTFKKEAKERGAEPDECYLVGKTLSEVPEIALEVIHTAPLLDKLDVYLGLGVPEVWIFKDGVFTVYLLDSASGRYAVAARSHRLPEIDLGVVARYAVRPDTPRALREFEEEIRRI